MPAPLSRRSTKLFVAGFILLTVTLIATATYFIQRGMGSEEWQARIQASREAREAQQEADAQEAQAGLDDPGEGGKAVRLPGADPEAE